MVRAVDEVLSEGNAVLLVAVRAADDCDAVHR